YLVTLPPLPAARPFVLTLSRNLFDGNRHAIIDSSQANEIGFHTGFRSAVIPWTITIVQGSEQIVGEPTTTTLTTRTTTTMAAITTTTRTTTFATMFITLTASSAMMEIPPPSDSRFRGNDKRGGNDEGGGNDKQPSFPRKRESPFAIALKGRPVHSTGQRPVTAFQLIKPCKGVPFFCRAKPGKNRKAKPPPV
ncbi:MAG: hypothetical protein ACR2P4_05100, partial [Gammaproteobacteria bacterium]